MLTMLGNVRWEECYASVKCQVVAATLGRVRLDRLPICHIGSHMGVYTVTQL